MTITETPAPVETPTTALRAALDELREAQEAWENATADAKALTASMRRHASRVAARKRRQVNRELVVAKAEAWEAGRALKAKRKAARASATRKALALGALRKEIADAGHVSASTAGDMVAAAREAACS